MKNRKILLKSMNPQEKEVFLWVFTWNRGVVCNITYSDQITPS